MVTTLTTSHHPSPHSSTSSYPTLSTSPTQPQTKSLVDPIPVPSSSSHGDHVRTQKTHQTGHASHTNQSHRPRNKDRERKDNNKDVHAQKRMSVDAPIPPAKRKNRRRKLSSSNESSTSEAPSNSSDFVHASGHHPLEQAGSLVALREGGGRRGEGLAAAGEDMLHSVPMGYSTKIDGTSSHSISPVNTIEPTAANNRGKRTSTCSATRSVYNSDSKSTQEERVKQ